MAEGLGASPFVFEKENLGQTPTKTDAAIKTPGSILKRERAVLGDLAPGGKPTSTKRQKKGSRLANRRVSFAPDDQLKTMHLYTKDDERQATPEEAPEVFKGVDAPAFPEQDLTDGVGSTSVPVYGLDSWNQELQALSPLGSFASPSAVSMELTDISQEYEDFAQHEDTSNNYTGTSMDRAPTGGITEGVPGLAELAEADAAEDEYLNRLHCGKANAPALTPLTEECEADLRSNSYVRGASTTGLQSVQGPSEHHQMATSFAARMDETADMSLNSMSAATGAEDGGTTVHSTGAFSSLGYTNVLEGGLHPAWGAAANETENLGDGAAGATGTPAAAAGRGAAAALPGGPAAPAVQVNKWGFVPGEEDTTDLDLEKNGLAVMGDVTYRHVFGGNDTTGEVTSRQPPAMDVTDDSLFGQVHSRAQQDALNAPETQPGDGAAEANDMDQKEEDMGPAAVSLPVFEDAWEDHNLQMQSPVGPTEAAQEEETDEAPPVSAGIGRTERRRRSSIADLTGRLLMDDMEDDSAPLAAAPPNSPLDNSAGAKATGKDMTTGLLLADPSPPADGAEGAADDGPLGELRRRLTLLQGPQKPMEATGFGRQDSSGPHTLSLLHGSTTQLLATRTHLPPAAAHMPAPAPTNNLADLTAASAVAEWAPTAGDDVSGDAGAELEMTPPPTTPAARPQADIQGEADMEGNQGGNSPDLLADQSLDDMEVPPELPSQWAPALGGAETPLRGLPLGGPLLARTPPPSFHKGQMSAMRAMRARVTPMRTLPPSPVRSPSPPVAASQVSYPMPDVDTRELDMIPGGPKLARTPIGPAHSGAPSMRQLPPSPQPRDNTMSPVQQVSGRASPQSSRRTPYGSAVSRAAQGGPRQLARTPQSAAPVAVQMTFQDFLKDVDLQFLDHMRRGTSINFADLASDPPPATLQESYRLLFLTAPAVSEMEESIRTLRETIAAAKETIAEREALIGKHNPRLFQTLQTSNAEEVEGIKASVAVLKRVCRQRTMVAWKDWRQSVEDAKRNALQDHLAQLREDADFLNNALQQARHLGRTAAESAAAAAASAQARSAAHKEEVERRRRLSAMQGSLQALKAANQERTARQSASQQRLTSLQGELAAMREQRAALEAALAADRAAQAGQTAEALTEASADAFLAKVEEMDILSGCVGWQLEAVRSAEGNATELCLRLGPLFRLRLTLPGPGTAPQAAQARLELTTPEEAPSMVQSQRQVAAALCRAAFPGAPDAGTDPDSVLAAFSITDGCGPPLAARLLRLRTQVARVTDAVSEAASLRLDFPRLASVEAGPEGTLRLGFLNLTAEAKFSVTLHLGPALFDGELRCEARVHFPGPAGITEAAVRAAAAAAAAAAGLGRLHAICAALSELADAREPLVAPPAATVAAVASDSSCAAEAVAADQTAPLQLFSNPLYSVNTPKQVC
ncbi:probable kinetochore protein spc7 at C-terminar half [Coccomyxa sp. Obi]|nr:probable kinetochore protein spc7 at C-terminar half [Coccomyxa sp. Obi]